MYNLFIRLHFFVGAAANPFADPFEIRVPGMDVPDEIIARLAGVPKEKQAEEGINICVEHIQELKEVTGVAGFHIMAIEWVFVIGIYYFESVFNPDYRFDISNSVSDHFRVLRSGLIKGN